MARIGGRSLWIAVPAGLVCAAVVGALVWLAAPMIPVAVQWVGDTLRASEARAEETARAASPAELIAGELTVDCRDLYPDTLWAELIWRGDVLLDQSTDRPPIASPELADALAPTVRLTCAWAFAGGDSIVSALSSVGSDAAPVAEASLRAQGFGCSSDGESLTCQRTRHGTTEEHVLEGGLWLASVRTGWGPDEYDSRLAGFVWR